MKYLSYRNLAEKGGPEFSEAIKQKQSLHHLKLMDGPNADGEMFAETRKTI